MRSRLSVLLLPVLAACPGPTATDASRYHGAALLDDGRTGFISYQRAEYRLDSPGFLGGGRASYTVDRKYLATVDITTGTLTLLHEEERQGPGDGRGNYTVRDVVGRMAFLSRDAGTDGETGTVLVPAAYALFDLDGRTLEVFDIESELEPLGLQLTHTPGLVHSSGILLGGSLPRPTHPASSDSIRILRYPGGRIVELGPEKNFRVLGDLLYSWTPEQYWERNLVSGERREIEKGEYFELRDELWSPGSRPWMQAALRTDPNGKELTYSTRGPDGEWQDRLFPVDLSSLR